MFQCHAEETAPARCAPAKAANDNMPGVKPAPRHVWSVHRAAAPPRWIGQVIAADATEAIEVAALEYRADIRRLIAVRRWAVA
jgi:hypothetical protein